MRALILLLGWIHLSMSCSPCSPVSLTESDNCIKIYSRDEWGARPPVQESDRTEDLLPYVFVHHSAMDECDSVESCSQAVRDIQNLHMDGNSWWDIGYSFLIGGDGSVFEGRGWNIQGAHTSGFNSVGYGVCFLGDFTLKQPTQAAIQAYHNLVFCMRDQNKIRPDYKMFGHRQTKPQGGTECPGDTLYPIIQSWPGWEDCTVEDENCLSNS
ncbi:peptidoglycan-recognition protein SC2 [Eurytemora carolleeae]|uniref:peptidoglycan-recognition protein SC2 n=1 Tax=Eurytemora carolleeae TaxID=1294199 RepID=UPI000C7894C1|nr:peptidoglycan-recognition protein SC2 [Eurytemora carolleeae]|eukprot:XP_023321631.1 peptidoglycan-recognition protein SC2-like [Eurytemora affinis]